MYSPVLNARTNTDTYALLPLTPTESRAHGSSPTFKT